MTIFQQALSFTLGPTHEGGHGTITGDKGGETYRGISRVYHPDWAGWPLVDQGIADDQLAPLVEAFYYAGYWKRVAGDAWPPALAVALFDTAVQFEWDDAIKFLQQGVGAHVDGDLGPETRGKVAAAGTATAVARLLAVRMQRHVAHPLWATCRNGWTRRCFDLAVLCGGMIA